MKIYTVAFSAILIAILWSVQSHAEAAMPTCSFHNGMTIWVLDYADSDTRLAHPIGLLKGTVDIHEAQWHAKCAADRPGDKVFIPFNYTKNGQSGWDTRYPWDVYRTRAEALAALNRSR